MAPRSFLTAPGYGRFKHLFDFTIRMTHQQLYDELKDIAEQLGLPVRLEMGDFDGGVCTVKQKRMILVNRRHDLPRRVNIIARAVHSLGLEGVFVKPALREAIEDEVAKASSSKS